MLRLPVALMPTLMPEVVKGEIAESREIRPLVWVTEPPWISRVGVRISPLPWLIRPRGQSLIPSVALRAPPEAVVPTLTVAGPAGPPLPAISREWAVSHWLPAPLMLAVELEARLGARTGLLSVSVAPLLLVKAEVAKIAKRSPAIF